MNKIRIKTFELLEQVLNCKFKDDNNTECINDDGITYISYDGNTGVLQIYITKDKQLPEGKYVYKEDLLDKEYILKAVQLNNVQYLQYIPYEQYLNELRLIQNAEFN